MRGSGASRGSYRYASEGQMGEGFAPEMVKDAFRPK